VGKTTPKHRASLDGFDDELKENTLMPTALDSIAAAQTAEYSSTVLDRSANKTRASTPGATTGTEYGRLRKTGSRGGALTVDVP
jgi:hypothetical protein